MNRPFLIPPSDDPISEALHRAYDHVIKEPVPQDMLDLLEGLE